MDYAGTACLEFTYKIQGSVLLAVTVLDWAVDTTANAQLMFHEGEYDDPAWQTATISVNGSQRFSVSSLLKSCSRKMA